MGKADCNENHHIALPRSKAHRTDPQYTHTPKTPKPRELCFILVKVGGDRILIKIKFDESKDPMFDQEPDQLRMSSPTRKNQTAKKAKA